MERLINLGTEARKSLTSKRVKQQPTPIIDDYEVIDMNDMDDFDILELAPPAPAPALEPAHEPALEQCGDGDDDDMFKSVEDFTPKQLLSALQYDGAVPTQPFDRFEAPAPAPEAELLALSDVPEPEAQVYKEKHDIEGNWLLNKSLNIPRDGWGSVIEINMDRVSFTDSLNDGNIILTGDIIIDYSSMLATRWSIPATIIDLVDEINVHPSLSAMFTCNNDTSKNILILNFEIPIIEFVPSKMGDPTDKIIKLKDDALTLLFALNPEIRKYINGDITMILRYSTKYEGLQGNGKKVDRDLTRGPALKYVNGYNGPFLELFLGRTVWLVKESNKGRKKKRYRKKVTRKKTKRNKRTKSSKSKSLQKIRRSITKTKNALKKLNKKLRTKKKSKGKRKK